MPDEEERPRGCKEPGHENRLTFDAGWCRDCHYRRKRARRASGRVSAVKRLYGWAAEELDALRAAQRGRCAICRRRVGVVKAGAVDHDHARERAGWPKRETVRGILCSTCNRYLGYIGDRPEVGVRLARYLIDPPAPRVLTGLDRDATMDNEGPEPGSLPGGARNLDRTSDPVAVVAQLVAVRRSGRKGASGFRIG